MASQKVEICLKKKKTHPEHKYSVTFVSKVGTKSFGETERTMEPDTDECDCYEKNVY